MPSYQPLRSWLSLFSATFFTLAASLLFAVLLGDDFPLSFCITLPGFFALWMWAGAGDTFYRRVIFLFTGSVLLAALSIFGWMVASLTLNGDLLSTLVLAFGLFAILPLTGLAYIFFRYFLASLLEPLWATWFSIRQFEFPIDSARYLLYTTAPLTNGWVRRTTVQRLRKADFGKSAELLAQAVTDHPDPEIRRLAFRMLDFHRSRDSINAVCWAWVGSRHPELARLILRREWIASTPLESLVLTSLLQGDEKAFRKLKPELVVPLLQACQDSDPKIAASARRLLENLESVETREALCQLVIAQQNPLAQEIALQKGYLPQDERNRALFLFLCEEWQRYDALDFDRALMHRAYLAAEPPLRERIREKVRASGRVDFLPILAGDGVSTHKTSLNSAEADVLAQTLSANRDWPALWKLAAEAPYRVSLQAITQLTQSGWQPNDPEERHILSELGALAAEGLPTETAEMQSLFPLALLQASARVPGRINDVSFAPAAPLIAVGTGQRKVVLWDYQTAQRAAVLGNFNRSIGQVAFCDDGWLACSERTNTNAACNIHIYPPDYHEKDAFVLGQHNSAVTALAPAGGGRLLSGGRDSQLILWDLQTRRVLLSRQNMPDWARGLRVSPEHEKILYLRSGLALLSLTDLNHIGWGNLKPVLRCADFSPNASQVFAGTHSGQVLVYPLEKTRKATRADGSELNLLRPEKTPLTAYPAGERVEGVETLNRYGVLLTVGSGGEIRFFSLATRQLLGSLMVPGGQATSVHISPDQSFMAVGSAGAKLTLWDLRALDLQLEQPFAGMQVETMALLKSMLEHDEFSERAKRALKFMQIVLRHRLRYAIEIGEAPTLALGEFDIEIE
jgi:hypothetical protein